MIAKQPFDCLEMLSRTVIVIKLIANDNLLVFLTIAIAPITLIPFGFKFATHLRKPATTAEPHLSRDIPAMTPEILKMKIISFRSHSDLPPD